MGAEMHGFAWWLAGTDIGHTLGLAGWVIPLSQTIRILGIAMVMSSIAAVDLRIMGSAARSQTKVQLCARRKLSR
jgi:hypothetical protein